MNINIIGVPIFYGCDNSGTQFGPDKFREKEIKNKLINNNNKVYDLGNIPVPYLDEKLKFNSNPRMKYFDEVLEVNRNLAHCVYMSLESGCFPLILGGDHSIGVGSISGVSKYFKNIGVAWIDAHGDFNTSDTSESNNIHGMSLALVAGYGNEEFTNLYFQGSKVKTKNIFHIGGRNIDEDEEILMNSTEMNIYNHNLIHTKGIDYVVNDILTKVSENNIDKLHISFDIDFMDESIVPGTGTKVRDGFDKNTTIDLLKKLFESGLIVSMEVVELNTLLDVDDITASLSTEIIEEIFKNS